jgi:hypothetical protein
MPLSSPSLPQTSPSETDARPAADSRQKAGEQGQRAKKTRRKERKDQGVEQWTPVVRICSGHQAGFPPAVVAATLWGRMVGVEP